MGRDAFERLYAEHAQDLFAFMAYRTGDPVLAEDLVADAFERAYRSWRRFDPRKASTRTWVFSIAVNCWRDHVRRSAVAEAALPSLAGAEFTSDDMDRAVDRMDVMGALACLSDDEREAIALRYGGGMTVPGIAAAVGVPLTTAEGRVHRGLKKLEVALGTRAKSA